MLLVVIGLFFWSCSKKEETIPDDVLPKDKMVNVLIDLHLAESKVSERKESVSEKVAIFNAYAEHIYEQHKTDSLQYKASHDYYMKDLTVMKEIYNNVSDSLQTLREEAEKRDRTIPNKVKKSETKGKKS